MFSFPPDAYCQGIEIGQQELFRPTPPNHSPGSADERAVTCLIHLTIHEGGFWHQGTCGMRTGGSGKVIMMPILYEDIF